MVEVPLGHIVNQYVQVKVEKVVYRSPETESGTLRAVHLSRHKWPGGLVN